MTYTPKSFNSYIETNFSKKDLETYTDYKDLFGTPVPHIEYSPASHFNSSTTGSYQRSINPDELRGPETLSSSGKRFWMINKGVYEIDYRIVFKVSTSASGQYVNYMLNTMDNTSAYPAGGDNSGGFWNRSQTIFTGVDLSSSNTSFSKKKYLSSPVSKTTGSVESNRVLVNFEIKGQIEYTTRTYSKINDAAFNAYHGFFSVESYFCRLTKLT